MTEESHESRPSRSRQWLAGAGALMLGLALLAACDNPPLEEELGGHVGAGAGGPAVNQGAVLTHDLMNFSGSEVIGTLGYDGSVFVHFHPDPEQEGLHALVNYPAEDLLADAGDDGTLDDLTGDDIAILITPILGRPDTPCRFQAALLARDEHYEILAAGDRKNALERDLHEVDLIKNSIPIAQRFYCFQLDDPFGVQVNVISADEEHQLWRVVHHIVNSVDRQ